MTKISELLEQMNDRQMQMESDIKSILIQTTKTNGRVDIHSDVLFNPEIGLQVEMIRMKGWKNKLKGIWIAVVIGSIVFSTVAGLVIAYYRT